MQLWTLLPIIIFLKNSVRLDDNFARFFGRHLTGSVGYCIGRALRQKLPFLACSRAKHKANGAVSFRVIRVRIFIRDHTDQFTRGRKWPLERQEISWAMRNSTLPKDIPANKRGCVPNYALWHNKAKTTKSLSGSACSLKLSSFHFTELWPFEFIIDLSVVDQDVKIKILTTLRHAGPDALWFYGKFKVRKGRHSTSDRMRFCHWFFYRNWKIAAFEMSIDKRCFQIDTGKAV